jgi:Fur family ferric uptake transcriptional regulator
VTNVPLCSVFRRYLKSLDLRYTTERADILDAVMRLDRVFEADEVLAQRKALGKDHRVSKATVYRTLKLLVEAGILAELQLDRERIHYQLVYGKPPSDFAICVQTGTRVEFTNPRVTALCNELLQELGWAPLGHRLQLYGVAPQTKPKRA